MSRLAQVDFDDRDGIVVVRIAGELDLSNVHDVGDAINAAMSGDAAGLVIDLTGLSHLDSAGMRLLFDLRTRLATARQRLAVAVPEPAPVREILDLADVPAAVTVRGTVAEALAAVAARG